MLDFKNEKYQEHEKWFQIWSYQKEKNLISKERKKQLDTFTKGCTIKDLKIVSSKLLWRMAKERDTY